MIADTNKKKAGSKLMPIDSAMLEYANWWFGVSWYGLVASGILTALAACTTVAFTWVQFWAGSIRDNQADYRTTELEAQTATAKADLAMANVRIAEAHNMTAALENETALAKERTAALEKEAQVANLSKNVSSKLSLGGFTHLKPLMYLHLTLQVGQKER
jgi:hypothetical protein